MSESITARYVSTLDLLLGARIVSGAEPSKNVIWKLHLEARRQLSVYCESLAIAWAFNSYSKNRSHRCCYLSYYDTYVTRGNKFKLQNHSFNHNFRKFFFSARIVNTWNSLPNYVVDVQSINVFKVRLDKFLAQQEVMFDWTADLTGTGDRSEYTVD